MPVAAVKWSATVGQSCASLSANAKSRASRRWLHMAGGCGAGSAVANVKQAFCSAPHVTAGFRKSKSKDICSNKGESVEGRAARTLFFLYKVARGALEKGRSRNSTVVGMLLHAICHNCATVCSGQDENISRARWLRASFFNVISNV